MPIHRDLEILKISVLDIFPIRVPYAGQSHWRLRNTKRTHPLSTLPLDAFASRPRVGIGSLPPYSCAPGHSCRARVGRVDAHVRRGLLGRSSPFRRRSRVEAQAVSGARRGWHVGSGVIISSFPGATPRDAMASSELTPSKSTQDLIHASRPGFPKGLRVRRRSP